MSDVDTQHSADKRSRDSPDSTLKPEQKSLKTGGVAVATDEEPNHVGASVANTPAAPEPDIPPQTVRWNVRNKEEVRMIMLRLHRSSPDWKLKICIEAMKVRPIDLSLLAKETSVMFASNELVEMAACCLEKMTAEMKKDLPRTFRKQKRRNPRSK